MKILIAFLKALGFISILLLMIVGTMILSFVLWGFETGLIVWLAYIFVLILIEYTWLFTL